MSSITNEKLKVSSPVTRLTVTGLSMHQRPGDHSFIEVRGIAEAEDIPNINSMKGQILRVDELDDNGNKKLYPIFAGIITTVRIDKQNAVHTIVIKAGSASMELDTAAKSRSFQDSGMAYGDIVHTVLNDTPGASAVFSAGQNVKIKKPLIQYQETDWAFIKRLASHFNAPIIPDNMTGGPNVWFGVPQRPEGFTFTGTEFTARVDKTYYELGGSEAGLTKSDFLYYLIKDTVNRRIGDTVHIDSRQYTICSKSAELVKGELIFRYKAGSPMIAAVSKKYNNNFIGLSLIGSVTKTTKETVELALDIDKGKQQGSYPYTWAPGTGNLVYCMPQTGTKASLYFPKNDEQAAFVNASIRENGSTCPTTSDPQQRGLVSEHGKHLDLFPANLSISNGAGLNVDLADAAGISLSTDKALYLIAKGRIRFKANDIQVQARYSIKFHQNGEIKASIDALFDGNPPTGGAAVEIEGIIQAAGNNGGLLKGTTYALFDRFDDDPTVGSYSPWKSILKAALIVALAVAVIAVCIAVPGLGAIASGAIIGCAIGGGMAAIGVCVSDLRNQENSSTKTYLVKTLSGAVTGAIMGAFGAYLGPITSLLGAGSFGTGYGALSRTTDILFGRAFDMPYYRQRSFWEDVSTIFDPKSMALDFGLAFITRGVINKVKYGSFKYTVPQETPAAITGRSGGRTGNAATRAQNTDISNELNRRGWDITNGGGFDGANPEEYLAGPGGGRAGSNWPDITAVKNGNTIRINTVDVRNGVMTAREAINAASITSKTSAMPGINPPTITIPKGEGLGNLVWQLPSAGMPPNWGWHLTYPFKTAIEIDPDFAPSPQNPQDDTGIKPAAETILTTR